MLCGKSGVTVVFYPKRPVIRQTAAVVEFMLIMMQNEKMIDRYECVLYNEFEF